MNLLSSHHPKNKLDKPGALLNCWPCAVAYFQLQLVLKMVHM